MSEPAALTHSCDQAMIEATGHWRGHAIQYDERDDVWRFVSDGAAVPDNTDRDCGFCGRRATPEGYDGCLGLLPSVRNACCGHGHDDESYIVSDTGNEVRGTAAIRVFRIMGCGPSEGTADSDD